MARRFTEEELNNIISDYKNGMTPKEMSEKYDRNSGTIIGKLKSIGVYKNTKHRFTDDDIKTLSKYYPKGDFDSIFKEIPDTTMSSIIGTCNRLGISADYYNEKKWTNEDLAVVEKCYYSNTLDEIREMICDRHSNDAIQTKALKYFGYSKDRSWTDEELDILYRYYPIESVDEVCLRLSKRTRQAIVRQANNLNIQSKFYLDTYWSDEEEKFLIDNWKSMSDKEIAKSLGRELHAIVDKRSMLKLARISDRNGKSYADLQAYIRGNLRVWKNESMRNCDYMCVLTGSKNFQIHHLYSFNTMFNEALEELDITLKDNFSDYTDDELSLMLNCMITKHNEYPLGVCIRTDLHKLFHHIYVKITTPDMWGRFVERYNNGEFKS